MICWIKELNFNLYRSKTKENGIRSGEIESRRVVDSVRSNPYEVSQYTNNRVWVDLFIFIWHWIVMNGCMRAHYVMFEKVSIM